MYILDPFNDFVLGNQQFPKLNTTLGLFVRIKTGTHSKIDMV